MPSKVDFRVLAGRLVSEGHQCFSTRVAKQGRHQAFDAGTLPWCNGRGMNAQ